MNIFDKSNDPFDIAKKLGNTGCSFEKSSSNNSDTSNIRLTPIEK